MTEDACWRRIASIVSISVFLASLLFPLCVASEPSVSLDNVKHDIHPVTLKNTSSSEVVRDNISISGTTQVGSKISIKKIVFGETTEVDIPVSASGSFSTSVQLEVGPGSVQAVERGDIKVEVVVTQGKATKELDVPLNQEASDAVAPNLVGASPNAGKQGYPHTFVAYNNPWLFYIGQYTDDSGQSVRTTKDGVATQLAKFSAVSLHYTDDASNIALIKQKNPNTKVFAYINPVFCYKGSIEYQNVVQHHPEWFLYPTVSDRQHRTNAIVYDGTEQVMDLTTGWQAEIVNLSKAALAKGFDGLYVDCVCDDPSLCYGYAAITAPAGNWHDALNAYLSQVHVAGKLNFYNGQSPVVVQTNLDFLKRTDGWMDEGFISYKGWDLSALEMPQYASALNKFTMFYAVNSNAAVRHFYFVSALLSDGYFFYAPVFTQWFSEYGAYLGNPVGQAYQLSGFLGVWTRDYAGAKVIVNPTSTAITVNMPGYLDSSGKPTSQITINPKDGVILKSNKRVTQVTLSASTTAPVVGQSVTFTATLKNGSKPLSSKPVTIYHYVNGVRYIDTTKTTDTSGKIKLTLSFGSTGKRTYYATFAGDSQYAKSKVGPVIVTVRKVPTTTTLTASKTSPAVNQQVTFAAKLYRWNPTTRSYVPLANKPVKIWHYLNGVRYTDTTKTTNANGQITLTQSFSLAVKCAYYATFSGDSTYNTSTSSVVNVNVH